MIEVCILAGGQGSRMQGLDKGLQHYQGRPLLTHLLDFLAQQAEPIQRILINANRHIDDYARYGHPVIQDELENFQGPLAGMQAGLSHSQSELCLFLPCDTPHLPNDLIARLHQQLVQHQAAIAIAKSDQVHPVICLMRTDLLPSLRQALAAGERKVYQWQQQQPHCLVQFNKQGRQFDNLNYLQDLH